MLTIGFPRAMSYYYLYPLFRTFVESLGGKLVLSPPTTQATLSKMEFCPTDEPCVAVKLLFAHSKELLEAGQTHLLIPSLVSVEPDNFCCPKFIGAPFMVRNAMRNGGRVSIPYIDLFQGNTRWQESFVDLARDMGVTSRERALQALKRALQVQSDFEATLPRLRLTYAEAYHLLDQGRFWNLAPPPAAEAQPTIGVIGHPYVLYDAVSLDLIPKIREYGQVTTPEMISLEVAREEMRDIAEGERLWSFEAHLLGAALHLLRHRLADRIILLSSFECGPESIVESFIEEEAQRQGVPFLLLTVDEHTGEAGLVTRIEAFMDIAPLKSAAVDPYPTSNARPLPSPVPGPEPRQMKVGFPSMGYLDVAIRAALKECGVECLPTPRASKEILELGKELSPEFVCLPFVITLGQMRYLLDRGATHILMVGGKGKCRLGWYAQIQEKLLRKLGYDFEMIVIDSPVPFASRWPKFREAIKKATGNASWWRVIRALYNGYHRIAAIDQAEKEVLRLRAYEREPGTADKLFRRFAREVEKAPSSQVVRELLGDFLHTARMIPVEETDPVRVRIVGEIWVVLEQYVNLELERMLGRSLDPRVWVDREISITSWFHQHIFPTKEAIQRQQEIKHAASSYLGIEVGGHGHVSVGLAALARQEGIDGVIHLMPFTCMPEIVAQNIMVRLSEKLDLPILTLIITDQTGEAGIETRIEAFLDLLKERKLSGGRG
ncbi:acyl-CoA dehydratase activase-related protein [Desulfothermobacter acidiphilus]|uniref:acyl-CoA dehydratase activase-related protein n=1 Tax=Desulfothermobacter acidiphilus TaxID=1938353 RepID=UPI003F887889